MEEKKVYEKPTVIKVEVDFSEVLVTAGCMTTYDCQGASDNS